MTTDETIEERKAQILMKLRGYKSMKKKKKHKESTSLRVKASDGKPMLILCWPTQGTVGVQIINQVTKVMKNEEVEKGILVTSGRYTQAAKAQARKNGIELIPRIFPSFNIFEHLLVPKHELISAEEKQKILDEYRVPPYKLPRLNASDPAAKAIDAKPGDIVRIIRDSPTAGKYISYRYVVDG